MKEHGFTFLKPFINSTGPFAGLKGSKRVKPHYPVAFDI